MTKASKTSVPFKSTPSVDDNNAWDANKAASSLRAWAASGSELDLSKQGDRNKYRRGFAAVNGDGTHLADYKLPHHEVDGGTLKVNKRGVSAAIAAINGARGGVDLTAADRRSAFTHLRQHLSIDFDVPRDELPKFRKRIKGKEAEMPTTIKTVRIAGDDDSLEIFLPVTKVKDEKDYTFVLSPVLVPDEVDKQNDIVSSNEIEEAAHGWMESGQLVKIMHQLPAGHGVSLVENYIVRGKSLQIGESDEIPEGTWVMGLRVYNDEYRAKIANGEITGLSIMGHFEG